MCSKAEYMLSFIKIESKFSRSVFLRIFVCMWTCQCMLIWKTHSTCTCCHTWELWWAFLPLRLVSSSLNDVASDVPARVTSGYCKYCTTSLYNWKRVLHQDCPRDAGKSGEILLLILWAKNALGTICSVSFASLFFWVKAKPGHFLRQRSPSSLAAEQTACTTNTELMCVRRETWAPVAQWDVRHEAWNVRHEAWDVRLELLWSGSLRRPPPQRQIRDPIPACAAGNFNNSNNNRIQRRYSRFFYNLLTAPRTVSNTYAQVAQAQSCANHVQHIECLSRASYYVTLGTKGQLSY